MNLNITQDNLYLLLPGKMTTLAQFYAEDHGCTMLEALRRVYSTSLYRSIATESTKLWHFGATDLYQDIQHA